MLAQFLVGLVALTTLVVVAAALCREILALRGRREVDQYLRWLMENATGPLGLSRPPFRGIARRWGMG